MVIFEDFTAVLTESDKLILLGGLDRKGKRYEYMDDFENLKKAVEADGAQKIDACCQCMAYLSKQGDVYEFGNCPSSISRDALYTLQFRTVDFKIANEGIVTLSERLWEEIRTGSCLSPY